MKSLLPLSLIAFAMPALLTGCNRGGDMGSTTSTDTNTAPAAPSTDTNAPAAAPMPDTNAAPAASAGTNAAPAATPDTNIAPSVPSK